MEGNNVRLSQGRSETKDMGINKESNMQGSEFRVEKAEKAFQRSKLYRLFSYCFSEPNEELVEFLRSGEFIKTVKESFKYLTYRLTVDGEHLSDLDFERIYDEYIRFQTLKNRCSFYENEYHRSGLSIFSTEEMADIAGFYRAIGFTFSGERPDHIGAELEFMHLITLKEAEALLKKEEEKSELCKNVERKFLQDHLGRWVGAFVKCLESEGSLFYSSIGSILVEMINEECRYLKVNPQKIKEPCSFQI